MVSVLSLTRSLGLCFLRTEKNDMKIWSRKEREAFATGTRGRYCLENSLSELAHILSHAVVLNKYYCAYLKMGDTILILVLEMLLAKDFLPV